MTSTLEKISKELWAGVKYNLFVPLSAGDEQRLLDWYRNAVDKYLPLIQQRTEIDLGEIKVKSLRQGIRDSFSNLLEENIEKNLSNELPLRAASFLVYPVVELARMYREEMSVASYSHKSETIFVPFGFSSKIELAKRFLYGENQNVDEVVLHELTHHLWVKIRQMNQLPNSNKLSEKERFWGEGFATYGESAWFDDFLPAKRNFGYGNRPKIYLDGRDAVEKLVWQHGQDILFDIPTRWEEFDA